MGRLGSIATSALLMVIFTVESTATSATTAASTTSAFTTAPSVLLNLFEFITILIFLIIVLKRLQIAFLFMAVAIFASFKWAGLGFFTSEIGSFISELGFLTSELGFFTSELGFITSELGSFT